MWGGEGEEEGGGGRQSRSQRVDWMSRLQAQAAAGQLRRGGGGTVRFGSVCPGGRNI